MAALLPPVGARISIIATAAFVFLAMNSVQIACADPIPFIPPANPKAVIEIVGDGDFTAENGVVGGTGTEYDPYIIRGLNLSVPDRAAGLYIHLTRASFVVKYVNITEAVSSYANYGILLDDVINGTVDLCRVRGTDTGISVRRSDSVSLDLNSISVAGNAGLSLSSCTGLSINGNRMDYCDNGILMTDVESASIYNNVITNSRYGIALVHCNGVIALGNEIKGTLVPYSDDSWTGNVWTGHEQVIDQPLGKLMIFGVVLPSLAALGVAAFIVRRRRSRTATV
jgi:parallel beta-helix repeat protein